MYNDSADGKDLKCIWECMYCTYELRTYVKINQDYTCTVCVLIDKVRHTDAHTCCKQWPLTGGVTGVVTGAGELGP